MKVIGIIIALLLWANLVNQSFIIKQSSASPTPITSVFNSCQLPYVLTREKMDNLASKLVDTLTSQDGDSFLELHDKWPEPRNEAERKHKEKAKKFASSFFSPGSIGPVTEESYQTFQYAGDVDGSEVFSVVYHLDAPKSETFDRVFLRFHLLFDGKDVGLARTEIKYQSDYR